MNDKTKEELKRFFKEIWGDAVVVALSLLYTLTEFLTLSQTGKSLWQIIAGGVMAFLMGFFMNREFEYRGLCEGDAVPDLQKAIDRHTVVVDGVLSYIDELETWCDVRNSQALRHARERIMAEGSLRYSDYFDADGMTRDFAPDEEKLKNRHMRKIELARIRTYYKALTLRLTPLRASVLISEGGRDGDPFYLGRSKIEYSRESSRKDAVVKIILAALFGYYGVTHFSWAGLIWKLFQVVVFIMMGTLKKKQAYSYMTEEFKGRITQKTMHLQTFMNYIQAPRQTEITEVKTDGDK